jgi:hypothetical protein
MPDQSSAADEHAILQEIIAPLARLPDDPVAFAADVDFPAALRGYDRLAVDAYVKRTSQLVAELQAARSPEAAIRRAIDRMGSRSPGFFSALATRQSRSPPSHVLRPRIGSRSPVRRLRRSRPWGSSG